MCLSGGIGFFRAWSKESRVPFKERLTVKLRGRTEAPEGAQSLSARGAKLQAPHGPLQRLLEVSPMVSRVSVQQAPNHLLVRNLRAGGVALEEIHTAFA
jgi:hypothetical protein